MPEADATWNIEHHRRALILRKRCSFCAEPIGPSVLFRAQPCPSCSNQVLWPYSEDSETLIDALSRKWSRRRWWVYGLVTLSTGATGFLPIVPTLIAVTVMIVLRYSFLREPLQWFSPARKFTTGFNLKLWLVTVSCVTLALNSILSLLPVANVVLNAVACLGTTALFVEVAIVFLRNRLGQEARSGSALETWEWAVPAGLLALTLATIASAIVATLWIWDFIQGLFT